MKNLLVCSNAKHGLKRINEGVEGSDRYILEGTFAELDTLNRNKRIYPKEEYLKHLAYLRDDIKSGEPLLGELDHPDDRFEVKLKEASHKIIDLWYDSASNTVQGKIELLNTPNGKLAQSMVDQGIPLHISSRAAGTVGNDNKVNIQQIYTYDLVCKPGFAGAVLHRVNESEGGNKYTEGANQFLNRTVRSESMNVASQFGFLNEEFSIRELDCDVKLRQGLNDKLKENENNEDMKDKVDEKDLEKKVEEVDVVDEKKDKGDKKPELKSVFEEGEENQEEKDSEKDDDKADDRSDEDKEAEGVKILSIEAVTSDDEDSEGDVEIKDVESEDDKDKDSEDSDKDSDSEEGSEDETSEAKTDECGDATSECGKSEDKGCNGNECDPKKDMLIDCKDIKDKKKTLDKIDELIDTIKKKKDECKSNESVTINAYPKSAMLNKSNFHKFMKLDESQKKNVIAYLNDNGKCDPESINESWENGINYVNEEVWLRYAPGNYKQLFEQASESVKNSIRNTAKYLLFENMSDVNNFWENTGLVEKQYAENLNEKFINTMPRLVESAETKNELPYSQEFINTVAKMASEYNY